MAYAGKNFGGFKVMAGFVGGPAGGAPGTPENFRKFAKKFRKKIATNALFEHILQKNLANHSLIFRAFGRKTQIIGKFSKIFKQFL